MFLNYNVCFNYHYKSNHKNRAKFFNIYYFFFVVKFWNKFHVNNAHTHIAESKYYCYSAA